MDPQQEIFTALRTGLKKLGFSVYDGGLPPDGTPYPFVYLADSRQRDALRTKDYIFGRVYQTIHVWHNSPRKRGEASAILSSIKELCRATRYTGSFSWHVTSVDQSILTDTTTKTPLLHAVLDVTFYFTTR